MTVITFQRISSIEPSDLFKMLTDYEYYSNYFPVQIKNIKIIKKTEEETIVEETIQFSTIFKHQFKQQTRHKEIPPHSLISEIISGYAKGTIIQIQLDESNSGTAISANIDLKLSLKVKILQPLIKKAYKQILTSLFLKIDSRILELK